MLRSSLRLAVVLAGLLLARPAAAQDAGTTGGNLASTDFFIGLQAEPGANLTDFQSARFFDRAACECDVPISIYVTLTASGFAKRGTITRTGNIEFWIGTDCSNIFNREQRCLRLKSTLFASFLMLGRDTMPTNARFLSTYTSPGQQSADGGIVVSGDFPNPTCTLPVPQFTQNVWVLVDQGGDSQYETVTKREVLIDLEGPPALQGPPAPNPVTVTGGDQALTVSWTPIDSAIVTDILGYQILCDRAGSLQVFDDGTFAPGFETCEANRTLSGVVGLDPKFICSPLLSISTSSFRIKLLQNDVFYGAAVVSIDKHGNASIPTVLFGKPIKTKSFYDSYREGDPETAGKATGGFCTLSASPRLGASAAAATAGLALCALVVARRRRRR
jgi:hypothetical protein